MRLEVTVQARNATPKCKHDTTEPPECPAKFAEIFFGGQKAFCSAIVRCAPSDGNLSGAHQVRANGTPALHLSHSPEEPDVYPSDGNATRSQTETPFNFNSINFK